PARCPSALSLHDALPISDGRLPTEIRTGPPGRRDPDAPVAGQPADTDSPDQPPAADRGAVLLRRNGKETSMKIGLIGAGAVARSDRKSTRLNSSHVSISY